MYLFNAQTMDSKSLFDIECIDGQEQQEAARDWVGGPAISQDVSTLCGRWFSARYDRGTVGREGGVKQRARVRCARPTFRLEMRVKI